MSSTNKTTNLQLSQFVGTDKPTWLTDYNGDMQKIDSGFQEIKEANASTQEELEEVKESMGLSNTEVEGIKEEIQQLKDNDNNTDERLITLSQNYETMHHEMVLTNATVEENKADLADLDIRTRRSRTVYVDAINGDDANDGLNAAKAMKTLATAYSKYYSGLVTFALANGEYSMPTDMRSTTTIVINTQTGATPTLVFNEGTYLFNKITIGSLDVVIRGAVMIYGLNMGCNCNINVESGSLTISECNMMLNGKTISGTVFNATKACVFLHGSTASITTTTAKFSNCIVMDGVGSITSAVTNEKSLIYSELTN